MEENKRLRAMADEIESYKAQYQTLIEYVAKMKGRYLEKIQQFEKIHGLFADEWQSLKNQI